MGCRVKGLGFRVKGLGFRVKGLGFRIWALGFRVLRLRIYKKARTNRTQIQQARNQTQKTRDAFCSFTASELLGTLRAQTLNPKPSSTSIAGYRIIDYGVNKNSGTCV